MLQILNVGPGIMAGDSFELSLRVERGAKVVIISQSATKLHTMPAGSARQTLKVIVEAGGELEYYPGLVIPYRDAEFVQTTDVVLQQGARFGMLERLSAGRVAFGEAFSFRRLSNRLKIRREERLVYADGLELSTHAASTGVLDAHTHLASGVWMWDYLGEGSKEVVKPTRGGTDLVHGSFGEGLYLRGLSSDGLRQLRQVTDVVQTWREACCLPPLPINRFGRL